MVPYLDKTNHGVHGDDGYYSYPYSRFKHWDGPERKMAPVTNFDCAYSDEL